MKGKFVNSPPAPSLDAKRRAIFIGATGTGKTHSCVAVASAVIRTRAIYSTWSICLISSSRRRPPVAAAGTPRSCCATISSSSTNSATCRFSQSGGQLLFHLVSKLYENTSLLITTNLVFAVWPQVFGYAKMTTAISIGHDCDTIETGNDSWRFKNHA